MAENPIRTRTREDVAAPALLAREAAEREAETAALTPGMPRLSAAPRGLRDDRRLAGLGRPLPAPIRAVEERRLGMDLSRVRLHDDREAEAALDERSARAMARGDSVAMRPADARGETPDAARLMRHEIAHVAQQVRPGAEPTVQRDGGDEDGIGRAPPDDPVVEIDGTGAEDDHVLFETDRAILTPAARTALAAAAEGRTGELVVHVHGYSSVEGDAGYNRNLSAHRAVAIRDALAPLLPEGTRFVLYAHGETDAFGEPADNRRAGVDFIAPDDGSFLSLGGPLSPFGPRRSRFHLIDPDELRLDPSPAPGQTPEVTLPPPPTRADLGLPPATGPEAEYGPRRPPPRPELFRPPPSVFAGSYNFGSIAREYGRRGVAMPLRDAENMTEHFEFWRLRFFQLGLPPDLATSAAQFGTDMAFSNQITLEAPFRHETLDRQFGTEPPPTFTILNETRMMWIFNQVQDLFERDRGR